MSERVRRIAEAAALNGSPLSCGDYQNLLCAEDEKLREYPKLVAEIARLNARWDKLRKAIEWAIGSKHDALAKILLQEMTELTGTAPEEEK